MGARHLMGLASTLVLLAGCGGGGAGAGPQLFVPNFLDQDAALETDDDIASSEPVICCNGDRVSIVWRDGRHALVDDIYANRSTDGGESWLAADARVTHGIPGTADARDHMVCRSGDNLYVAWHDLRNDPTPLTAPYTSEIYFNHSADGGATWMPVDPPVTSAAFGTARAFQQRICCNGMTVAVVWSDDRDGDSVVRANVSTPGGP